MKVKITKILLLSALSLSITSLALVSCSKNNTNKADVVIKEPLDKGPTTEKSDEVEETDETLKPIYESYLANLQVIKGNKEKFVDSLSQSHNLSQETINSFKNAIYNIVIRPHEVLAKDRTLLTSVKNKNEEEFRKRFNILAKGLLNSNDNLFKYLNENGIIDREINASLETA
jgi:hypothetical protein